MRLITQRHLIERHLIERITVDHLYFYSASIETKPQTNNKEQNKCPACNGK